MGGGVALYMAEIAPERIQSLILVSAIGVQELELLGDYHINHALHGAKLTGIWLLQEAVPHFGWLDDIFRLQWRFGHQFWSAFQC